MINQAELMRNKLRNTLHTVLLFLLMALILLVLGFLVAGIEGMMWAFLFSLMLLFISPKVPPELIMKMYQGRLLHPSDAWELYQILDELSKRARIPHFPKLYYIPSHSMNAFSIGNQDNPVIAMTDGLLKALDTRELLGVLAHEISHIRQNDMIVMGYADIINRMVSLMALLGVLILFVSAEPTGLLYFFNTGILIFQGSNSSNFSTVSA